MKGGYSPSRPKLPFHAYSSYNKKDGLAHPDVVARRNTILEMYQGLCGYEEIADALGIHIDTVNNVLIRARRRKDPRVSRPVKDRRVLQAKRRNKLIKDMHDAGYTVQEIAKRLGVSDRLVQMRLKDGTKSLVASHGAK